MRFQIWGKKKPARRKAKKPSIVSRCYTKLTHTPIPPWSVVAFILGLALHAGSAWWVTVELKAHYATKAELHETSAALAAEISKGFDALKVKRAAPKVVAPAKSWAPFQR
jgi:hypothetical protein